MGNVLSDQEADSQRHVEGSRIGLQGVVSWPAFLLSLQINTCAIRLHLTIFAGENKSSKLLTGPFVLLGRGHLTEVVFNSVCTSASVVRTNLEFFDATGINELTPALVCVYSMITGVNLLFEQ